MMKEFIDKLIAKMEEEAEEHRKYWQEFDDEDSFGGMNATLKAIEIVKELAEEHNGGWIPCSERLPEDDSICIVTVEYPNNETVVDYGWFDRIGICWYVGIQEFRTSNILAWMPLPASYVPKGE